MHERAILGSVQPRFIAVADITSLTANGVVYTSKSGATETITADALVIATGSSYKGAYVKNDDGLQKLEWLEKLAEWRTAAAKAKHVLIVGGGVTGTEVAGELATEHPTCKVTLIHSGKYLCNETAHFHVNTLWGLTTLPGNVEVLTEDRVEATEALSFPDGPRTFTTKKGATIVDVDMVLMCAGVVPNSSFISAEQCNEKRELVVDETLQVPSLTSAKCCVFAVGDVTHCGWGRAMVADAMAKACVVNILKLAEDKPLTNVYNPEKKPFLPVLVSLGRTQGVANVPFNNNFLGRWVKAPTLLAGLVWPKMGIKGFSLSAAAKGPSPLQQVDLE